MKCSECSREIPDQALFCGYCGAAVKKEPTELIAPEQEKVAPISVETHDDVTGIDIGENLSKGTAFAKRKHGSFKAFLVFSIFVMLSGGILGFAVARDIIDWRSYIPTDKFKWTDFAEGMTEVDVDSVPVEEPKEEKEI